MGDGRRVVEVDRLRRLLNQCHSQHMALCFQPGEDMMPGGNVSKRATGGASLRAACKQVIKTSCLQRPLEMLCDSIP